MNATLKYFLFTTVLFYSSFLFAQGTEPTGGCKNIQGSWNGKIFVPTPPGANIFPINLEISSVTQDTSESNKYKLQGTQKVGKYGNKALYPESYCQESEGKITAVSIKGPETNVTFNKFNDQVNPSKMTVSEGVLYTPKGNINYSTGSVSK